MNKDWLKQISGSIYYDDPVDPAAAISLPPSDLLDPPPDVKPAEPAKPAEPTKPAEPAVTEPVVTTKPAAPVAPLSDNKTVEEMVAELNRLSAIVSTYEANKPSTQEPTTPAAPAAPQDLDFVGELGADIDLSDTKQVKSLLNKIGNAAYQKAKTDALTSVNGSLGGMISERVQLQAMAHEWWVQNSDLRDVAPFIGAKARELSLANPTWDYQKLYDETEKSVRSVLHRARPTPVADQVRTPNARSPIANQPKAKTGDEAVDNRVQDMEDFLKNTD